MGVYIKNMEKPKKGEAIAFDGEYAVYTDDDMQVHRYSLIEIDLVRCGECKWWDSDNGNIGYCHAEKHSHFSKNWEISIYRKYKADHYCSDGERRE